VHAAEAKKAGSASERTCLIPRPPTYYYLVLVCKHYFITAYWLFVVMLLSKMGQIFVSTELLRMTETDSQLAVVLGHEISHALLSHGVCVLQRLLYFHMFNKFSSS